MPSYLGHLTLRRDILSLVVIFGLAENSVFGGLPEPLQGDVLVP